MQLGKKKKVCPSQAAHTTGAYPGFLALSELQYLYSFRDGMRADALSGLDQVERRVERTNHMPPCLPQSYNCKTCIK